MHQSNGILEFLCLLQKFAASGACGNATLHLDISSMYMQDWKSGIGFFVQHLVDYFTYKAVKTVLAQLSEMNPLQYAWFYKWGLLLFINKMPSFLCKISLLCSNTCELNHIGIRMIWFTGLFFVEPEYLHCLCTCGFEELAAAFNPFTSEIELLLVCTLLHVCCVCSFVVNNKPQDSKLFLRVLVKVMSPKPHLEQNPPCLLQIE